MKCTLIITTKNEEKSIERLLDSVVSQTHIPDEIILADAGSKDKTRALILSYNRKLPLKLMSLESSANRAVGRNRAIAKAKNDIILITDAGCVLDSRWVEHMLAAFRKDVDVVAGYYRGEGQNVFERCQIPYVLVMPDRYDPNTFLPATRSMGMRKRVWKQMGGFTEKYRFAEDYIFARTLRDRKYTIAPATQAIVTWRARPTLMGFAKMLGEHAQGDAFNGAWRKRVLLIFLRYLFFALLLVAGIAKPVILFLFILTISVYLVLSVKKNYRYVRRQLAYFYLPLLQIVSDLVVMMGTLKGLLLRLVEL